MSGPAARFAVVGDALLDVSVRHRAALELGGDVPAEEATATLLATLERAAG